MIAGSLQPSGGLPWRERRASGERGCMAGRAAVAARGRRGVIWLRSEVIVTGVSSSSGPAEGMLGKVSGSGNYNCFRSSTLEAKQPLIRNVMKHSSRGMSSFDAVSAPLITKPLQGCYWAVAVICTILIYTWAAGQGRRSIARQSTRQCKL